MPRRGGARKEDSKRVAVSGPLAPVASLLGETRAVAAIRERLLADGGAVDVSCAEPLRPALLAALRDPEGPAIMVVVAGAAGAGVFARDLALFIGLEAVTHVPEFEEFAWEGTAPDPAAAAGRAGAVWRLGRAGREGAGEAPVIVTSVRTLLRRVEPVASAHYEPLWLRAGATLPPLEVAARLVELGYERCPLVESPGQFALRGGILDVFPGGEAGPIRAEYLGDDVESLRRFVASSQQSIGPATETPVFACRDLPADPDTGQPVLPGRVATLAEALPEAGLVVLVEPRALIEDATRTLDEVRAAAPAAAKGPGRIRGYVTPAELPLGRARRLTLYALEEADIVRAAEVASERPEPMLGRIERLLDALRADLARGRMSALALRDLGQADRLAEVLAEHDLPLARRAEGPRSGAVWVVEADLSVGWSTDEPPLSLYAHGDVFPASRRSRPTSRQPATARFAPAADFEAGGYVVHRTHGIARFAGLVRREVAGHERDYLLLEYAAGDKLYVPMEQVDRVSRYIGADASAPRLTRLATQDWSRATAKARASAKALAFDLSKLYADRGSAAGWAFSPDSAWAGELAAGFPFTETPDQLAAIEAVREDMEKARPMDRLVCGDVGYGKTEVAIRAAFKAVQDGKQAIILAPTTILAQQHYQVFSERYAPFPVDVEVLSRFKTDAEQARVVERFDSGEVDVLIGTHRLLSPDVKPRDLGLVVIDEEQRFGVGHKEHFAHLRRTIDVLTLSATPIPRTLQMALSGVRDLSLIETPPEARLPVETHVGSYDEILAAGAIRRELARDGQVYYVHNRIHDIDAVARRVGRSVPEARVAVAHGRMPEHALEQVMLHFLEGEVDVLVSTTIIENGLDIPTANTLIVENAERLGLAQLYQLRGRVGRSPHRAYAYLFYGDAGRLTSPAAERLSTVHELTALGSGVRIALKDLEIRGAGNLLGPEQSGQMAAVGFELYVQMLREAVGELMGEPVTTGPEIRLDLPVDAYIPEDYVPQADARVEAYRGLAAAGDAEELASEAAGLTDRYGRPLPGPVAALVDVLRLRHMADALGLRDVSVRGGQATLAPISLNARQASALRRDRQARYVENAGKLVVRLGTPDMGRELAPEVTLGELEDLLSDILQLVVQA